MSFSPKVTKVVTRPILKFENDKPLYVRILAAWYLGAMPVARPGSTRVPVAPTLVDVDNLDDSTGATLPIHPKLKATFIAAYPDNTYVGKCFMITKNTRRAGRQFTPYDLAQIEDPKAPPAAQADKPDKPDKPYEAPVSEEKPTQLRSGRR